MESTPAHAAVRSPTAAIQWAPTSEMYSGTSADDRPMPMPVSRRPASMPASPCALAHTRAPASIGMESSRKAFLRPRESARPEPATEPTAAPASTLLTTCGGQQRTTHYSMCAPRSAKCFSTTEDLAAPTSRNCGVPQQARERSGHPSNANRPSTTAVAHQPLPEGVAPKAQGAGQRSQRAVDHAQGIAKAEGAHGSHCHAQQH